MATIASILAAQQQEKTDLATLAGAIQQLLTAFASGQMTAAQAQQVLTEMQAEDTTIQSLATSINNTLNPPAPAPPAGS